MLLMLRLLMREHRPDDVCEASNPASSDPGVALQLVCVELDERQGPTLNRRIGAWEAGNAQRTRWPSGLTNARLANDLQGAPLAGRHVVERVIRATKWKRRRRRRRPAQDMEERLANGQKFRAAIRPSAALPPIHTQRGKTNTIGSMR